MFQSGDILADRFQLERLAGAGAMGQVWLARDRDSGSALAVKVLTKAEREEHAVRFTREALLLSQLSHPRIVRYVAHGHMPSGAPYLAMEWLDGEDLAGRLSAGPLTIDETISLIRRVAEGLAAAHAAGIVHRDIKPSNLFLPHGSIDAVKLVDFGIARTKDSSWTKTGLMLGTPAYMSPEQACGEREIDARADLFGLGCVAFECLTGRCAFGGTHVFAVLRRILLEEAPSLAELVPAVPPELDALIKRMMAKDPAARPRNASDVETALGGLVTGGSDTPRKVPAARLVLSKREQRIITVLSVADAHSSWTMDDTVVDDSAATEVLQPSPDRLDPTGTLRAFLERSAGKVGRCAAESFVLVFPASGVPTDRAAQAAECALSLGGIWPGRAMALASGRTEMSTWTDGEAAERASRLLIGRAERRPGLPATNILIDDVTASLLDARFEVIDGASGLELCDDCEHAGRWRSCSPAARSPRTPFVGRERELGAIRAILQECVEESVARVVLVTAAPGMGKSRLRRELLDASALAAGVQIWTARGDAMHAGSPFGLISQLTRCARAASTSDDVPMNTQAQQEWIDFLARACKVGAVLLVLEDLQWGDSVSIRLLDAALRDLRDAPLMIMAFARPEVYELFPKLWADRPIDEIRLTPLTKSASEGLVRAVLRGRTNVPDVATILQQADGVPLYLEVLARAAAEDDGANVPDAALAMVQSRFDKLDAHTRRVLRAASVFGRTFWRDAVLELVASAPELDEALTALSAQKLISRQTAGRFPGEQEYEFSSALVREGAYAMLTDADRALGHELAAGWLERVGEQNAALISRHRELGGRRRTEMIERDATV